MIISTTIKNLISTLKSSFYPKKIYSKNLQISNVNLDDITEKNDNKSFPYRRLIIRLSGSGKTNYLLNLIQKDNNIIDRIWLYAKDCRESKYQLLINVGEQAGIKNLNDPTAFIEYSNTMDDILDNIEDYNKK